MFCFFFFSVPTLTPFAQTHPSPGSPPSTSPGLRFPPPFAFPTPFFQTLSRSSLAATCIAPVVRLLSATGRTPSFPYNPMSFAVSPVLVLQPAPNPRRLLTPICPYPLPVVYWWRTRFLCHAFSVVTPAPPPTPLIWRPPGWAPPSVRYWRPHRCLPEDP